ncbi:suppressor of fused domain protein [Chryseobacterium sp. ON_d1]|uniref:suppressor of fused domain protein n=1 Tax=Chryseobacterium sp. ON_d1 TaxID=2583211 RepID=UPI001157C045|nr:suppressor of fused domain protein [Chryseobacterium sp. ON_d1]GEJ48146.1 hypothetical protein CRS_47550 [Chryseobacterium sp. ON_d1]
MKIVEHLEKHIGKISNAVNITDKKYEITVSLYDNIPFEKVRTYSTLGMNQYFVGYYFELIMVCDDKFNKNEIASFLTSLSEYFIDNKKGIRRGDVMTLGFSMTSETKMNSLYFTLPFYFDDDLQQLKLEDKTVIFPLIIPVYNEEALLINKKGWNSFETFLEDNEIDNLWDLKREPYIW